MRNHWPTVPYLLHRLLLCVIIISIYDVIFHIVLFMNIAERIVLSPQKRAIVLWAADPPGLPQKSIGRTAWRLAQKYSISNIRVVVPTELAQVEYDL